MSGKREQAERRFLSYEAAVKLLPNGNKIHTFLNPGTNFLVGADWTRAQILKAFKKYNVEVTGEHAQASGHGLAFFDGQKHVFVATKQKKRRRGDSQCLNQS
jgi:hypothetical protein